MVLAGYDSYWYSVQEEGRVGEEEEETDERVGLFWCFELLVFLSFIFILQGFTASRNTVQYSCTVVPSRRREEEEEGAGEG